MFTYDTVIGPPVCLSPGTIIHAHLPIHIVGGIFRDLAMLENAVLGLQCGVDRERTELQRILNFMIVRLARMTDPELV